MSRSVCTTRTAAWDLRLVGSGGVARGVGAALGTLELVERVHREEIVGGEHPAALELAPRAVGRDAGSFALGPRRGDLAASQLEPRLLRAIVQPQQHVTGPDSVSLAEGEIGYLAPELGGEPGSPARAHRAGA